MIVQEVIAMEPGISKLRAYAQLSAEEQARVDAVMYAPAELIAQKMQQDVMKKCSDACDRYSRQIGKQLDVLLAEDEPNDLLFSLLKLHAANQLRCEAAGIPPPDIQDTLCHSPWTVVSNETLHRVREHVHKEVFSNEH